MKVRPRHEPTAASPRGIARFSLNPAVLGAVVYDGDEERQHGARDPELQAEFNACGWVSSERLQAIDDADRHQVPPSRFAIRGPRPVCESRDCFADDLKFSDAYVPGSTVRCKLRIGHAEGDIPKYLRSANCHRRLGKRIAASNWT